METKWTYQELDELPQSVVRRLYLEGEIDTKKFMGFRAYVEKNHNQALYHRGVQDGVNKDRPSKEWADRAYGMILDYPVNHKEAMEYSAEDLGHTEEWVKNVKNQPFRHSREIYDNHKEHPNQQELSYDIPVFKTVIPHSCTVNQLAERLAHFRDYHVTLQDHEDRIECLEDEVDELHDKVEAHSYENQVTNERLDFLERMYMKTKEGNRDILKQEVLHLRDQGMSMKKISETVDVPKTTVVRWVNSR
jgi:hypothetical protein